MNQCRAARMSTSGALWVLFSLAVHAQTPARVNCVVKVEPHSCLISVVGAVRLPVTFQATGLVTLIDAITRAGGLAEDAAGEVLVRRTDDEGEPTLTHRIPYRQLIDAADPELNLRLTGGEEIRIPAVDKVLVVGNVKRPGASHHR